MNTLLVRDEKVNIPVEVILFNDEKEKVLIVSKGKTQREFVGKIVVPMFTDGRNIDMMMGYQGDYYKSYVVGRDKVITSIGHVIEPLDIGQVMKDLEEEKFEFVKSSKESNILLLDIE